jgi:multidrug efflux system membrane fusion protein
MNDVHRSPVLPADSPEATSRGLRMLLAKRRLLAIVAAVLGLALLAWLLTPSPGQRPGGRGGRFASSGPMPVATAAAFTGDMPIVVQGLGTVTPLATVTVQSQISGQIVAIKFKEGQMVKRGDPLIEIDPRPYQVALEQAQGALARDQALLANARIDLKRYETLFQEDSIAEQQLATQRATVLQDEGTVKTDQAAIDAAKLNLAYCHIASPIDGLAGLQQVNLGNYVTPSEPNGLLVVTQLQPITVVFPLPEDQIPPILDQLHQGSALPITAYDRSHRTKLAEGTMATVDSQIDTSTGTLKLKALFPNADRHLFPNQFVNVDLLLDTLHGTTLIPQSAIERGAPGTFVYVVNPNSTVSVRKIALGPADVTNVSVISGLTPGEQVVVDGADRLKDGAKILLRSSAGDAGPRAAPAGQLGGAKGQHRRRNQGSASPDGAGPSPQ